MVREQGAVDESESYIDTTFASAKGEGEGEGVSLVQLTFDFYVIAPHRSHQVRKTT